jgi:hypothetical protein
MLGNLPRLERLALRDSAVADAAHLRSSLPMHLRPLLPALADVELGSDSMASLHVLARWTRVRSSGLSLAAEEDITSCTVAVKGWDVGWLRAVLIQACEFSADGVAFDPPSGFALADDADVVALAAAVAGLESAPERCKMALMLGGGVGPGSLRLLAPLYGCEVHIAELPEGPLDGYVCGWGGALVPEEEHLRALAGPGLEELVVRNGSLLGDGAVRALLAAAPALRELHVEGAGLLTDRLLWALCARSRRLEWLTLHCAGGVTAAGALPLLTAGGALHVLKLVMPRGEEGCARVRALLSGVKELCPDVGRAWSVWQCEHQLAFTSRKW